MRHYGARHRGTQPIELHAREDLALERLLLRLEHGSSDRRSTPAVVRIL
jgi:hypothetical protein